MARAAERLGIEQSPLSRAMRDLERSLGVPLFDRSSRLTRLNWAGQVLLGESRRVLATVDQAIQAARGEAQGYQSCLRIAICDSLAQSRIATLLARRREEEPELEIRVFDMAFSQQIQGLHHDLLDGDPPMLSTYLLRRGGEPSELLKRFICRVKCLALSVGETREYQIVCRKAGRRTSTLPWPRRYMYEPTE